MSENLTEYFSERCILGKKNLVEILGERYIKDNIFHHYGSETCFVEYKRNNR